MQEYRDQGDKQTVKFQWLEGELLKEQESRKEIAQLLDVSREEIKQLNESHLKEKELLTSKYDSLIQEKELLLLENEKIRANNESLLLNIEIHNKRAVKIVIHLLKC